MNRMHLILAPLALILLIACGEKAPPPEKYAEGQRLLEQGNYAEAVQYFEGEIAAAPDDPDPVFMAGQAAAIGAMYPEAESYFNRALEMKPETAEYYSWLGRIYGAQARSADIMAQISLAPKIRKNFEKAYELDPKDADNAFFLGIFYVLAPPPVGGNPAKAETIANEMMKDNPVLAHRLLAQFNATKKNPEQAEAEYKAALELAPDDPQSYSDLGTHYISRQMIDLALENFAKSVELDPKHEAGLFGLGQVGAFSPEQADAGIEALNELLALPPTIQSSNRAVSAHLLGTLYERKGMNDEAVAAFEKAAEMGFAPAQKKLDEMKPAAAEDVESTATMETTEPADTDAAPVAETESAEEAPAEPAE